MIHFEYVKSCWNHGESMVKPCWNHAESMLKPHSNHVFVHLFHFVPVSSVSSRSQCERTWPRRQGKGHHTCDGNDEQWLQSTPIGMISLEIICSFYDILILYIYHIQCVYIYTHYIKAWHWILSSSRTNTSNLYEVYWHYLGYVNNSATWKVPPVGYPTPSPIIPVTPRREVVII